jgi:hypothetical protein
MNPLLKFNHISWKLVLGMNLSVLALAVTFASLKPTTTSTEHRSQAKDAPNGASPTIMPKPIFDPENPPELIGPDIDWAKIGDAVVVTGENLGRVPFGTLFVGTTAVPQENIIVWEPTQIVFTVPYNTVTGIISLTYINDTEITLTTKTPLTITEQNR